MQPTQNPNPVARIDTPTEELPVGAVLVHGAWHGGWCFDALRAALSDRGVGAVAPDLPGHGSDQGAQCDLAGDAAAVVAVIRSQPAPVVLMGHSYGGLVITEAIAQLHEAGDLGARVKRAVFLCAIALPGGTTFGDLPAGVNDASGLGRMLQRTDGGSSVLNPADPVAFREVFAADCSAEHAERSLAQASPQLLRNLREPARVTAASLVSSTYVVCTKDAAIPVAAQRAMVEAVLATGSTMNVVELVASHSPYASMPAVVADILLAE
jgi:pimeloyl-ACP methyl ester carboxylesterase